MTPPTSADAPLAHQLDDLLREAGLTVKFGLRQQEHFETVRQMRAEHKTWQQVNDAIGWSGRAVEVCYELESAAEITELRRRVAELEAKNATLKQEAQGIVDYGSLKCPFEARAEAAEARLVTLEAERDALRQALKEMEQRCHE